MQPCNCYDKNQFTHYQTNKKNLKMSEENDLFDYDDDAAVAYIRPRLPRDIQDKYSDNDIIYIGDIIYDFYEKKGFFDESDEEAPELNVDELIRYVRTSLKKDGDAEFDDDDVEFLVRGELDYEESLGMWEA